MRAWNYAVGITAIVGLVFLLSACGKPAPGKGATSAPPSAVASRPEAGNSLPITPQAPGSVSPSTPQAPVAAPPVASPQGRPVPPIATAAAGGGTERGAEAAYRSARPLYAKLALTADRSKVLSVLLDESYGTGKGYDIVYVDTNFNGRFEQQEAVKARPQELPIRRASFPPINLGLPYNEKGKGIANPCSLSFIYSGSQQLFLDATTRLAQGSVQWEYRLSEDLKPSGALASAPVAGFTRAPTLAVTTKPDLEKKGNLGIALGVVAGKTEVHCRRGQGAPEAHIIIRDTKGGIVHEATAAADKFAFG